MDEGGASIMGQKVSQKVHTSSHKINKSCDFNVQQSDGS